jgi:hypothetical protein
MADSLGMRKLMPAITPWLFENQNEAIVISLSWLMAKSALRNAYIGACVAVSGGLGEFVVSMA